MAPSSPRPAAKGTRREIRPGDLVQRIVVPVEGSDREFYAQQWATELAAALDVPLFAIHVSTGSAPAADDLFHYMERACREHKVMFEPVQVQGEDVAETVSLELGPRDLVVIGTERMGSHYKVGSVTSQLIRLAPCPVQVVRLA